MYKSRGFDQQVEAPMNMIWGTQNIGSQGINANRAPKPIPM